MVSSCSPDTVVAGPDLTYLQELAFEAASERAGSQPASVLYVTSDASDAEAVYGGWEAYGNRLQLSVETLDDIVDHVYDRSQTASSATYSTRLHHRLATDAALHAIPETHRFAPSADPMRAGHLTHLDDLFTLLEFADLHSASAIKARLEEEGLPQLASEMSTLRAAFDDARATFQEEISRSLRAERYHHTTTTNREDHYEHVDHIIIGDFTQLSPLEAAVLDWLTTDTPTHALLPTHEDGLPTGVHRGLKSLYTTYTDRLNLTQEYHTPAEETTNTVHEALGRCYQPTTNPPVSVGDELEVVRPMDVGHETRYVTRHVHELVTTHGVSLDDIGILLTDTNAYRDHLLAATRDHELPIHYTHEQDLPDTRVGSAFDALLDVLGAPTDTDRLADLLRHPLTSLPEHPTIESQTIASALNEHTPAAADDLFPTDYTGALTSLVDTAEACNRGGVTDCQTMAAAVGLEFPTDSDEMPQRERDAWDAIERLIETVATRPTGSDQPHWRSVLQRALTTTSITTTTGPERDSVDVRGLLDTGDKTYDYLFVLGLTETRYPSRGRRLEYPRQINEAHPDFARSYPDQDAAHALAVHLSAATESVLTRPRSRPDGSSYIDAGILTELRRHVSTTPTPVDEYAHHNHTATNTPTEREPIGSVGDVWRATAVTATHSRDTLHATLDSVHTILTQYVETATANASHRLVQAGAKSATARATGKPGPYNGWLDPSTAAQLTDASGLSPTEIETAAECGFKHYADYVLDLADPREDDESLAADRGGIVHDILDTFYTTLQNRMDNAAAPVDIASLDRERVEAVLYETAVDRLAAVEDDAVVTSRWRRALLAGLATPDLNPQYNPWGLVEPVQGTLAEFIEEEYALRGATDSVDETVTTTPVAFERSLQGTIGDITLYGTVDRVDVTDDGEFVVRDYKTGSVPSEGDILDGLAFQLPVYLLLAAAADADRMPIGGTYYQVAGPGQVSSYSTVLTGSDDAAWHANGGRALRRHNYPRLDTRSEFTEFLTETIPRRLQQLQADIQTGTHHPTVNDPADAGCEYCDYSDVCDVRSEGRHEFIENIDTTGREPYITSAAQGTEYDPASADTGDASGGGE